MNLHKSKIKELLDKEADNIKSDTYFFTVYFPTKDYTKLQIVKRLKSLVLTTFRNSNKLDNYSKIHEKILEIITEKINKLNNYGNGIAVFVTFNAEKLQKGRLKKVPNNNIELIVLKHSPKKESYLGKTYDLDQLVWLDNVAHKALLLNLSRQAVNFYILDGDNLEKLNSLENEYLVTQDDEQLEKYSPIPNKKVVHETGSENIDRKKLKENELFLNDIAKTINKAHSQKIYDYLICFYSSEFKEIINILEDKIEYSPYTFTPIFKKKNYQVEIKLKKAALKQLQKAEKQNKNEIIDSAKETIDLYASGWKEVTEADRLRKINILFINPTARKKGYLLNKNYVYTYPVKNSRLVRNIGPWLVKNVISSGGKVISINDSSIIEKDVSASLRYR